MKKKKQHPLAKLLQSFEQKRLGLLLLLLLIAVLAWCSWLGWGHRAVYNEIAWHATKQAEAENKQAEKKYATEEPAKRAEREPSEAGSKPAATRSTVMAELGQSGDVFGGANALFAALAGAAVVWAGYLQAQTLKKAEEELEHEKKARKLEQFETRFFHLLELSRSLAQRIDAYALPKDNADAIAARNKKPEVVASGVHALEVLAQTIHSLMKPKKNTPDHNLLHLTHAYMRIYRNRPSALGAYFRTFHQAIKTIDSAEIEDTQKTEYANIARDQLSDGVVLLLALNCCVPHGREAVPLVEKYGLLKNMLGGYKVNYKPMLRELIRERAFQSEEERGDDEADPAPLPMASPFTVSILAWQTNTITADELSPDAH